MTETEFQRLAAAGYNRVPLVLETFADLDTPLSIYLKLADAAVLLPARIGRRAASASGATRSSALPRARRASTCAADKCRRGADGERSPRSARCADDPLEFVARTSTRFRAAPLPGCRASAAGWSATSATTPCATSSRKLARRAKPDPLGTPDIAAAAVRGARGRRQPARASSTSSCTPIRASRMRTRARSERLARARCAACASRSRCRRTAPSVAHAAAVGLRRGGVPRGGGEARRTTSSTATSCRCRSRSASRAASPASPLALYRALRALNPSPYMFYFDFGDFHVVGASPEILVRLRGRQGDAAADRRHAAARRDARGGRARSREELLADPKERAEHVMLIDLGRNDVGRVARDRHACSVTEQMVVERYSHVMHIVSNVEGRLKPGLDAIDVLRATFPAGTVTGAPKVRAMEIIDELEPVRRGVYARRGRLPRLQRRHGRRDRDPHRGGQGRACCTCRRPPASSPIRSPESEWHETQNKARALLRAAEMAQRRAGLEARMSCARRPALARAAQPALPAAAERRRSGSGAAGRATVDQSVERPTPYAHDVPLAARAADDRLRPCFRTRTRDRSCKVQFESRHSVHLALRPHQTEKVLRLTGPRQMQLPPDVGRPTDGTAGERSGACS